MISFNCKSQEETIQLGYKIGSLLRPGDVIAMSGTLGAGKTTITKGIAQALGIEDTITSPTFCLISEYQGTKLTLNHMDVYRLEGDEDFLNLGVEEMLYGDGICIVEWSDKVKKSMPKKTIWMTIKPEDDGSRTITLDNWKNGEIG